ncbi:UNVERIFIED_CONTAM: NADH-ubiquinone oxidoreductase chain 1 [Trichonephila clavipes]
MIQIIYNFLEILIVVVPILLAVAFMTIIERKVMGSMQRRIGPNVVGYYGVLQPFADALKLVVKEQVIPTQATKGLFFLAPIISLIFSLLGWGVIPFGPGLALSDFSLGILYSLALSSIGVYGILFAGWSANSKYAFLGALRSTAQMISYELVYSAAVLAVLLLCGSFNITQIIDMQQSVWYILPLFPIFILFFVAALAETNRTPFDLPEAESELVAGFMTEHSGMIFVFFFLAEYCSIVLISTFTAILFLGGYNLPSFTIYDWNVGSGDNTHAILNFSSISLGIKSVFFIFVFVWIRATLPRLRYDQLIVFCWTQLLPMAIALLILVPSLLIAFDISI